MDRKTAEALEESIKHWEENVAAEWPSEASVSADDCALCEMFNIADAPYEDRCIGCPVQQETGAQTCDETPYDNAFCAYYTWARSKIDRDEWRKAATAELEFLKSLRSNPDEA